MKKISKYIFDKTKDKNKKFHDLFIQALKNKKTVILTFLKKQNCIEIRRCIPYDFGPVSSYKDERNRYHFFCVDINNNPSHPMYLLSWTIQNLEIEEDSYFDSSCCYFSDQHFISRD